jgi:hypothetical protein
MRKSGASWLIERDFLSHENQGNPICFSFLILSKSEKTAIDFMIKLDNYQDIKVRGIHGFFSI